MTGFQFPWQKDRTPAEESYELTEKPGVPDPIHIEDPPRVAPEGLSDPFDNGYAMALKDVAEIIRRWQDRAAFGLLRRNRKAFEGIVEDLQKQIRR